MSVSKKYYDVILKNIKNIDFTLLSNNEIISILFRNDVLLKKVNFLKVFTQNYNWNTNVVLWLTGSISGGMRVKPFSRRGEDGADDKTCGKCFARH